jgi:hypothetical protein
MKEMHRALGRVIHALAQPNWPADAAGGQQSADSSVATTPR